MYITYHSIIHHVSTVRLVKEGGLSHIKHYIILYITSYNIILVIIHYFSIIRLGKEGEGFAIAMAGLDGGRLSIGEQ
jgi:hypothetical protein